MRSALPKNCRITRQALPLLALLAAPSLTGCFLASMYIKYVNAPAIHVGYHGVEVHSAEIGIGLNATYYTDFATGSFHLRPEIGVGDLPMGPTWIRGTVGYSIPITNIKYPGVNSLQVG